MITVYHNNRCSKSRCAISFLEEKNLDFKIVKYLETPPTFDELSEIISLLNIKPIDLIRKNEAIWKTSFKGKTLTDEELIKAMIEHPKLIERPIIIKDTKAVIGRPTENISTIL